MAEDKQARVCVGRVAGAYGVRGWLKVDSYTEPAAALLEYRPWLMARAGCTAAVRSDVVQGRAAGRSLVVQLAGIADRDAALALQGAEIWVERSQLPDLESDQYYWADLEGARVVNLAGIDLGIVDHLLETGANDVMVVRGTRERLVPFIRQQVIKKVDLKARLIEVDWDPDF